MFTPTKPKTAGQIFLIETDKVIPNGNQPREHFDTESIRALSDSIRKNGIIQPLTVRRRNDGRYELIAGERRLRAAKMANLKGVPCIIMEIDDRSSAMFALIENIQRQELNFVEEARAIQRLSTIYGMRQEEIAVDIGKSQSAVSNLLRILRLPADVQTALVDNGLTQRHGRALLKLSEPQQREAVKYIIEKKLTVKQTEQLVERMLSKEHTQRRHRKIFFKDVKIFVNTINHAVEVMQSAGIKARCEKTESEDEYTFVVRIPKGGPPAVVGGAERSSADLPEVRWD